MTVGSRLGGVVQVVASLVVTAVLVVAIEIGAGLFLGNGAPPPPAEIPGDAVSRTLTWLEINPAPLVRDAELLWRNEPGARKAQPINPQPFGRREMWTIENNSEGLRGPERAATTADEGEVYRILCVGDSVTFGFNVDQAASYPRQLQALLESRHPGHRFEVLNAGVPGWTWLQGLRFLEIRGLALHPDVVVMGHGTNDQLLPAKITDEERFRRLAGPVSKLVYSVGALLARTNTYRVVERVFPPPPFSPDQDSPGCQEQIRQGGNCHRVSLDEIAAAVHEVHRLTAGADSDLVLVNLDFAETPAVRGVQRTASGEQIPFLDAVEALRVRRRSDEDARAARLGLMPASLPNREAESGEPPRGKRVVLRVAAPDRVASYRVEGGGHYQPAFAFTEGMHDDGTHGDERSGDGVYSTTIEAPAEIAVIIYRFHRDDEPEFKPLPPLSSSMADRLLAVPSDTVGPVDVLGESLFMAERAHPNADGHAVIATLIADRLEGLPSFPRFVGAPDDAERRQADAPAS